MRVVIVGGGFGGLAAGIELVDKGIDVTILEAKISLGGLAGGFAFAKNEWPIEGFYHHVFTNDKEIIDMAMKVGWPMIEKAPRTSSLINGTEKQLDSPISLLFFDEISLWGRIRMGMGLAILKVIKNGLFLEKYRVVEILPKLIGQEGYKAVWEKLLKAKFGSKANVVNMAWFWSRVAKRTKNLGYFEGGFLTLAEKMGKYITDRGGRIRLGTKVREIVREGTCWVVNGEAYDKVILTVPEPLIDNLLKTSLTNRSLNYLWGQTLILKLKHDLTKSYWLNILEKDWPFLVAVEHTKMIEKEHYGGNTLVYLGNYLEEGDKRLKMSEKQLFELYSPYLKMINRSFEKKWVTDMKIYQAPYAQPVFEVNASTKMPPMKTDMEGIFIVNMSMVYPFDRGTNFAVKMGQMVAQTILGEI